MGCIENGTKGQDKAISVLSNGEKRPPPPPQILACCFSDWLLAAPSHCVGRVPYLYNRVEKLLDLLKVNPIAFALFSRKMGGGGALILPLMFEEED